MVQTASRPLQPSSKPCRFVCPQVSDHCISCLTPMECIGIPTSSAAFRPGSVVAETSVTGPLWPSTPSRRPCRSMFGSSWNLWPLFVGPVPLDERNAERRLERNRVHCRRTLRKGVIVGRLAETTSTAGSMRDQSPIAVESGKFSSVPSSSS